MLSKELLYELQQYVDKHLLDIKPSINKEMQVSHSFMMYDAIENEIVDFINDNKKPSFSKILFRYIDKSGLSDSEVYKKAGIDRRHFSKIRSIPDYHPSKNTVIALALALRLKQKEAYKLIEAAGYTLSDSETFDLVIKFCFERNIYDIVDVNLALDYFSLKSLSGVVK